MANSTLMFSGINPEGRNSSKVLRPPGGGSSLGPFTCEEPEETSRAPVTAPAPVEKEVMEDAPQPVQEPEPVAVRLISDILCQVLDWLNLFQPVDASPPVEPEPVTDCPAPEPEAASASNGCEEAAPTTQEAEVPEAAQEAEVPEAAPEENVTEAAPVQAPAAPLAGVRGRVPPGGHSSGPFWWSVTSGNFYQAFVGRHFNTD